MPLDRDTILAALRRALEPLPFVNAMWEGGAAAHGRVDQWSDIDIQVDVDDAHAAEVVPVLDRTLAALSPIDIRFVMPPGPFKIYAQVFYQLREAGPYLLVDVAVLEHSVPEKFLTTAIHGNHVVHFDKIGVVRDVPIDEAKWKDQLAARVAVLRDMFPLFQILTKKELPRGNNIEALAFYHSYTLRPLIELLRIEHAPHRYNFHTRYVHYDLPAHVVHRLEQLFYVATPAELAQKQADAEAWFAELMRRRDAKPATAPTG